MVIVTGDELSADGLWFVFFEHEPAAASKAIIKVFIARDKLEEFKRACMLCYAVR